MQTLSSFSGVTILGSLATTLVVTLGEVFSSCFSTDPIVECDVDVDNRAIDVDWGILSSPIITIPDFIHAFSDDDGLERAGSIKNVLSLTIWNN